MGLTLENLYQILKKNVESLNIEDLATTSFYTEEYDKAVYQYLSQATDEQSWIIRLREIRNMEQGVAKLLAEHLQKLMRRALGGLSFK